MDTESKEKKTRKHLTIKSIFQIIGHSLNGIGNYFAHERSAIIYSICVLIILALSFWVGLSIIEWLLVILLLVTTLAVELLNTGLEAVCDLVSEEYHPLIKIAKDSGSAATGVLTLMGLVLFFLLYLPKILEMIG